MRLLEGLFEVAWKAAIALGVVAFALKLFFVDVYKVTNNGMAPTVVYGDEVLVWRGGNPDLGNIMLCEHPSRQADLVMGRALTFAGHTVSTDRFGNLYVDTSRSTTEILAQQRFYDVTRSRLFMMNLGNIQYSQLHTGTHTHHYFLEHAKTFQLRPYTVNRGMYLLADNRSESLYDSREFGEVDPNRCVGQVFMRLRPAPKNGDDIDHSYFDLLH